MAQPVNLDGSNVSYSNLLNAPCPPPWAALVDVIRLSWEMLSCCMAGIRGSVAIGDVFSFVNDANRNFLPCSHFFHPKSNIILGNAYILTLENSYPICTRKVKNLN